MVELALATPSSRGDAPGEAPVESSLVVEKRGSHSAHARWSIRGFGAGTGSGKQGKTLWSRYWECGGYDCRLLVYPTGDSQALPGYVSVYLQISDPGNNNSKWDCFASYRLSVRNLVDDNKSVHRDSWHRFSAKKKSHGWCDFAALNTVLDPKSGFLGPGDTIVISTDITILHESVQFSRESDLSGALPSATGDVYSGKFVWRVHNFSAFQPLLKTQKIMSPGFPAGDCLLRLSVYQSTVSGGDYLSVCLESKDTDKTGPAERTCWCLFRLAVTSQAEDSGGRQVHKDSYGRFAADSKAGDNTSLGWNDFMRMSDFLAPEGAYLVGDTAVFSTTFHVIREYTSLTRNLEARAAQSAGQMARYKDKRKMVARESDFAGKFTWRIEHFTRLKDLLKKRKITGLCIKSKRFTIGGRDCRLIVYPRGQSQPPTYLSMFLEVCDPRAPSPDWTCFVSHRLAVVNQKAESEKSVSKESQNRYSKTAKDWGWREFVSLTTLFDADAGFLVNDAVVFAAEVLVLRESCDIRHLPLLPGDAAATGQGPPGAPPALPAPPAASGTQPDGGDAAAGRPPSAQAGGAGELVLANSSSGGGSSAPGDADKSKTVFTWRIENFQAFKDIMETRKIFSRFFSVGPCELRIGLYESFESLCLYLESDAATAPPSQQAGPAADPAAEKPPNYWVRYRMAVLNQRHPERTEWKEAAICTRSWNNSVLQFMRVPSVAEGESGYVLRDSLAITCEVLECCPWLDFAEGELGGSTAEGPPLPSGTGAVAAAADKAGLSLSDGEEGSDDDDDGGAFSGDETEEEEEEGESDVDDLGEEEEDALSGWLAAAGVQLAGGEAPPRIADPSLVRRALGATLAHQPGAVPMFVASLRMYMDTLAKVKCLLMPGATATPIVGEAPRAEPGSALPAQAAGEAAAAAQAPAAPAGGSSLMHVLMSLPQLQQPLLGMLLDVMLDHCLTARMHRHELRKQQARAAAAAGGVPAGGEAAEVARPGGASPGAPLSSASSSSRQGAGEDGGASSGYVSSEESSYEDAFEGPGEGGQQQLAQQQQQQQCRPDQWQQQQQQAGAGPAATAAAQRLPNGVLRGLTPLPPRRQQVAAAQASSGAAADLAGAATAAPAAEQVAAEAARHDEPGDAGDAVTDLEEEDLGEAGAGAAGSAAGPAGGDADEEAGCPSAREVEQVVALILGWLRGLDSSMLQPLPAKAAGSGGAVMRAPLSSLQKVSMLLADAPRALQPDIILLVPRLVDASEHTAAAGTLLGRLAEASREGADAEGELRMPVLAALGMLHIDPAVADKVLHAALEALPCLSESELPPAVGLVLKLASESGAAQGLAVRVVRQRIRAAAGAASAGTLDAVRLAVLQHRGVARAMLADIEADAREALALAAPSGAAAPGELASPDAAEHAAAAAAAPSGRQGRQEGGRRRRSSSTGSTGAEAAAAAVALPPLPQHQAGSSVMPEASYGPPPPAPPRLQMQLCDMEVLLDLLSLPDLQRDAVRTAELCCAAGTLHEEDIAALVERRRVQQLAAAAPAHGAFAPLEAQAQSAPASPARAVLPGGASPAVTEEGASWQPQHSASLAPGSSPASSMLPPREPQGAPTPAASATLLSALSLLEGQSALGRLGGSSGSVAPLPSLPGVPSALLPPQQQAPATPLPSAIGAQPPLPPSSCGAAGADEYGGLVLLTESLQASAWERCRSCAARLYRSLLRLYGDDACRSRLLRSLVHRTLGYVQPAQQQQQQQQQQSATVSLSRSASGSAPRAPPPTTSPPAVHAVASGSAGQEGSVAQRWSSDELLATLLTEQPDAARVVVGLSMEAARVAAQQVEQLQRQAGARDAAAARELQAAREEVQRQSSAKNRYIERAAELDTQLTRAKAEHRAELAGLGSDKKELQAQIRSLETQLEWVRSERDEERASKSREGREAAQRAVDAEAQLTRLKGQRREEQKRWQKEKAQLADRVKELEERQKAAEQEAARLRSEASSSAHRHDKTALEMRRRAEAAERAAAERDAELGKARAAAAETEAKLRAHQDAVRKLERRLAEEVSRSAAVLHGVGLEALGGEDLEALGRLHDQGLKRVNAQLAKRGRAPLGGAAASDQPLTRSASPAISGGANTPVPSAAASPIDVSKTGYRPTMTPHAHGHGHPGHHQQQHGGSGHHGGVHHAALRSAAGPPSPAPPLPPGIAPSAAASLHAQLQSLGTGGGGAGGAGVGGSTTGRALSLNSSLDSLQSLGSVSSTNSLFSGPWGSSVHSMSALQQAAAAAAAAASGAGAGAGRRPGSSQQQEPAASAAMDAANMEKLMGLLPSDLLHS